MGDPVRALNEKGIQKFLEYLTELRGGSAREPPVDLLTDKQYSDKTNVNIEVERKIFNNKLDAAKFLYEKFRILPQSQIEQNVGLWSWLSLYYFDQMCPKNKLGRRIPGRDCRHILDLDYRRYYYHLLVGPYNIYTLHGGKAPLLLSGPLYETGKHYLELSARQGFITNKGVIEAANLLYFDTLGGKPKRGAALTARKPGALIRFIDVVQQLDLTYDLYSMTGEEVLSLLPSEFDEWRSGGH
jgi:hypothetical protein